MVELINLTPHPIVVDNGSARKVYEPSGVVARVETESTVVGEVDGFDVVTNRVLGHNVPDPKEGVVYIVSAMVLALLSDRTDLVAPDTGKAARNEQGHIVSVPGFVRS